MRIFSKRLASYVMAVMLAATSLTLPVAASASSYDNMELSPPAPVPMTTWRKAASLPAAR